MSDPTILDDGDDPYRAIRVGEPGAGETTKWGQLLTLFMRIIALFWVVQGLMQWRVILEGDQPDIRHDAASAAFSVIFFAVLDLVAAVGLWLATPWGGVLWLLIASAQIFVASSMPSFFAGGYWLIGVDVVLIAMYFALTFEAGRDFEARRMMRTPPSPQFGPQVRCPGARDASRRRVAPDAHDLRARRRQAARTKDDSADERKRRRRSAAKA